MVAAGLLALQGAQVARGNHPIFLGLIGAAGILAVIFYAYRKRIYEWIRRRSRPGEYLSHGSKGKGCEGFQERRGTSKL